MASRAGRRFWYGCASMVGRIGAKGRRSGPRRVARCLTPKRSLQSSGIKELEQQLELMSQKAQFFETVVDVLKNDYGCIGRKSDPACSLRKVKSR